MDFLIPVAMIVVLLALGGLVLVGGRAIRQAGPGAGERDLSGWPPVALVVPVTGAAPDLADNLRSLLTQDYPDYQALLVTREAADPATSVILALLQDYPQARHVLSGPAAGCGQKNHNLLAGLRLAGDRPDLLAFGDATRLAPASFLRSLVRPIVLGEASVTSGYHQVMPGSLSHTTNSEYNNRESLDIFTENRKQKTENCIMPREGKVAAWGWAITVLALYLTKGSPRLNQPWGGATAISRRLFTKLRVARLWAENVVDDVSLAARLKRAGIAVVLAPGAVLTTSLGDLGRQDWGRWLKRQWLYLKFCCPGSWLAGGIFSYLLAFLTMLAGWRVAAGLLGLVPAASALGAGLFLGLLTGLGLCLRRLHPRPPARRWWLAAAFAALFMAAWSHLETCFTRQIHWRGLTYRVTGGGRVRGIRGQGIKD